MMMIFKLSKYKIKRLERYTQNKMSEKMYYRQKLSVALLLYLHSRG